MRILSILCLSLALGLPAVRAEDDATPSAPPAAAKPTPVDTAVKAWLAAEDDAGRAQAALRLSFLGTSVEAVQQALERHRTWVRTEPLEAGVTERWTITDVQDREHTVFGYLPDGYTPTKAWPVIVWLHGGVNRPQDGAGVFGIRMLNEEADAKGFLVVSPSGMQGSAWWTPAGVDVVRKALAEAKSRWNVDATRVYAAGHSDGASGCFHLLQHDPDPYAGFLAFMGHPVLTRVAGGPAWATNSASRPIFAVHGGKDQLYPSAAVKPLVDQLREAGARLEWRDLPDADHSPAHIQTVWEEAWAWALKHPRPATPKRVSWTTSRPAEEGRVGPIQILGILAEEQTEPPPHETELPGLPTRPRLGIQLDTQFEGPGLRISEVQEGTPAETAGFLDGDVIVAVDGEDLGGTQAAIVVLRRTLDALGKDPKATAVFTVARGDEQEEIRARPEVLDADRPQRPAALGYDQPAGNVTLKMGKDGRIEIAAVAVETLRLYLTPAQADGKTPLVVICNGKTVHEGVVKGDVATFLSEVRRDGTTRPRYSASLLIRP